MEEITDNNQDDLKDIDLRKFENMQKQVKESNDIAINSNNLINLKLTKKNDFNFIELTKSYLFANPESNLRKFKIRNRIILISVVCLIFISIISIFTSDDEKESNKESIKTKDFKDLKGRKYIKIESSEEEFMKEKQLNLIDIEEEQVEFNQKVDKIKEEKNKINQELVDIDKEFQQMMDEVTPQEEYIPEVKVVPKKEIKKVVKPKPKKVKVQKKKKDVKKLFDEIKKPNKNKSESNQAKIKTSKYEKQVEYNKYYIQLMTLASKTSVNKVKKKIRNKKYNFYIHNIKNKNGKELYKVLVYKCSTYNKCKNKLSKINKIFRTKGYVTKIKR